MRIGILLPTILASNKFNNGRIFAPMYPAIDLADGLVSKGHTVFFYTSQDIKTKAEIIAGDRGFIDKDLSYFQFRFRNENEKKYTASEVVKRAYEYSLTMKAYKDALEGKLDIIHSFHDFGAHYFDELTNFPTVYTLHDPLPQTDDTIEYMRYKEFRHHNYVSISNSQRKGLLDFNFIATVYHGINLREYEYNDKPQKYFIYFGRLIEDKGVDLAIEVSKTLNVPLKIASSQNSSNIDSVFFETKVKPFIDGSHVISEGFLSEKEKSHFINQAMAYIFPLRWEEPFGLTVIEAMACGTPVVAFDRGSVPELVKDGSTGFIVPFEKGVKGLEEALKKTSLIDRKKCREWVEQNFTVEKMVENYENVYKKVVSK